MVAGHVSRERKVMAKMAQSEAAGRVITVAPQSGQAIQAERGELVRVVDVEGHQVGDMWAIDAADPLSVT